MADSTSFPQIPSTVWWGVREILSKSPKVTFTEGFLAAQLNVQPAAARQYITELKRAGLLTDEGKATDSALKWRLDVSYAEAVGDILERCYAEELRVLAPAVDDREKAVAWFKGQGLGEGSARNKAATYFLIGSVAPGETAARSAPSRSEGASPPSRRRVNPEPAPRNSPPAAEGAAGGVFPVNLNLQIHISADASLDQIDAIFSSMRKHLGNAKLS